MIYLFRCPIDISDNPRIHEDEASNLLYWVRTNRLWEVWMQKQAVKTICVVYISGISCYHSISQDNSPQLSRANRSQRDLDSKCLFRYPETKGLGMEEAPKIFKKHWYWKRYANQTDEHTVSGRLKVFDQESGQSDLSSCCHDSLVKHIPNASSQL